MAGLGAGMDFAHPLWKRSFQIILAISRPGIAGGEPPLAGEAEHDLVHGWVAAPGGGFSYVRE